MPIFHRSNEIVYPQPQPETVNYITPPQENEQKTLHLVQTAVVVPILQSVGIFIAISPIILYFGMKYGGWDWGLCLILSWIPAVLFYGLRLFDWRKAIKPLEKALNIDLDGDGKIGKQRRPTIHIRITAADGTTAGVVDTRISENEMGAIVNMANCFLQGRPTSQAAMKKNYNISRGNWQKVLDAFIELGIIEKENPAMENSKFIIASKDRSEEENRELLKKLLTGEYDSLDDIWDQPPPHS